jgi:uncharacterized membrane protein
MKFWKIIVGIIATVGLVMPIGCSNSNGNESNENIVNDVVETTTSSKTMSAVDFVNEYQQQIVDEGLGYQILIWTTSLRVSNSQSVGDYRSWASEYNNYAEMTDEELQEKIDSLNKTNTDGSITSIKAAGLKFNVTINDNITVDDLLLVQAILQPYDEEISKIEFPELSRRTHEYRYSYVDDTDKIAVMIPV